MWSLSTRAVQEEKNPYGLLNGILTTPKPGPVEEILTLK